MAKWRKNIPAIWSHCSRLCPCLQTELFCPWRMEQKFVAKSMRMPKHEIYIQHCSASWHIGICYRCILQSQSLEKVFCAIPRPSQPRQPPLGFLGLRGKSLGPFSSRRWGASIAPCSAFAAVFVFKVLYFHCLNKTKLIVFLCQGIWRVDLPMGTAEYSMASIPCSADLLFDLFGFD